MSNTNTTNGISPIYYNEDADRFYRDVDGIRLVYEAYTTHGAKYFGKLVGYYRPGLVDCANGDVNEMQKYTEMLRGMLE